MNCAVILMSPIRSFKPNKTMCYKCNDPEMAGLHAGHLPIVQKHAPSVTKVTGDIFSTLTKNLNPHLPAFTALVAMVESLYKEDFGVLGEHRLIRLPLSVIGSDKVRYRTQTIEWLHESILSMRMSEVTTNSLRRALNRHGLCIMFLCSCGVVIGRCKDVRAFYGSPTHLKMDRLRSAIDASGNPVAEIESLDEILVPTMDLCINGAESRLFARIEELTKAASDAGHQDYAWIDEVLGEFISVAQSEKTGRQLEAVHFAETCASGLS